ncbi:MAG: hypothetical protein WBA50_12440 [Mycobacterium sp.]
MSDPTTTAISRRIFIRGAVWSGPALGIALAAPRVLAVPPGSQDCGDPNEVIENCVVQLPEEFTSTSFSTTAVVGGTNYSILFSTNIRSGPLVPPAATGYRINSIGLAGTKRDGVPFSITPHIGERGPRVLGARSASSLGFVIDAPWTAGQLVRNFAYTFDVVYLNGLTEIQTCSYVTAMTLAENGMIVGGVGSVAFSPPRLTSCGG